MGKREQYARVLLRAATTFGVDVGRVLGRTVEDRLPLIWAKIHGLCGPDRDAWLSLYDTMQCAAPAGSEHDEPPARRAVTWGS